MTAPPAAATPTGSPPTWWAGYAVVVGGATVGSTLRWATAEVVGARPGEFPIATLVVNLVGCLLVGLAATRVRRGSLAWLALVTGGLGGLTTYSTFAAEVRTLLGDGRGWTAAAYVAASLAGGLAVVAVARRAAS